MMGLSWIGRTENRPFKFILHNNTEGNEILLSVQHEVNELIFITPLISWIREEDITTILIRWSFFL